MRSSFARLCHQHAGKAIKPYFRLVVTIGMMIVMLVANRSCQAQELEQLRESVRQPSASSPPTSESPPRSESPQRESRQRRWSNDDDEDCDDDDALAELIVWGALIVVATPFCLPRSLIDDDTLAPGRFSRYPYPEGGSGLMRVGGENCDSPDPLVSTESYDWLVRMRTEHAESFDDVSRTGGQLLWDTSSRWGIDTQFDNLRESRDFLPDDDLWVGDANLVFRFAQSPRVQMRTGFGFNWLKDDTQSDFGFNFTYGGDFLVKKPWVVSTEIDWGLLGNTNLFRGRVTTGFTWHRCELYTGYEYLEIGSMELNGLIAGIRIWQSGRLPSF
jgi:hypothetical protein